MGRLGRVRGAVSPRLVLYGGAGVTLLGLAALVGVAIAIQSSEANQRECERSLDSARQSLRIQDVERARMYLGFAEKRCSGNPELGRVRDEVDRFVPMAPASRVAPPRLPPTLPEAIARTKANWGASSEWDDGSIRFARYSQKLLTETEITKLPETTVGMMLKDPDAELGKHICFRGEVVEIYADGFEGLKMFRGGLYDGDDVAQFLTPWGTADIVKGTENVVFCGVFTGIFTYTSTKGEQVRAIKLVGAFRLGKAAK